MLQAPGYSSRSLCIPKAGFPYLRVYMGQLRKKVQTAPSQPKYLLTEAGVGYRFVPWPTHALSAAHTGTDQA